MGLDMYILRNEDEDVAYWRKANAIHSWFVNNVQDGEDDCGKYSITRNDIENLLLVVNEILNRVADKIPDNTDDFDKIDCEKFDNDLKNSPDYQKIVDFCEERLPAKSGFFFGNVDYGYYYFCDLVDTKEKLIQVLDDFDDNDSYYYHSSW